MKLRIPEYCSKFRCIADKCRDSCCIGWEIDIDHDTAAFYDSVEGDFGKRLKESITTGETRCFKLDSSERCPFLNESNLCDIYINLGEENLCQICTDHPRYYEWFDGLKEGGIGLCCEAAAPLILSEKFAVKEVETLLETADEYSPELYNCLFKAREKIISSLDDNGNNFYEILCDILIYAENLQFNVDNGDFKEMEIIHTANSLKYDIPAVLRFMQTLEVIDEEWIPYIKQACEKCEAVTSAITDFRSKNPEVTGYLRNIAIYFIWRYFMKGVFDGEFISRVKLMTVSCFVIEYLCCFEWLNKKCITLEVCSDIAGKYSKEIEYCEENLLTLSDAFYELDIFSTSEIME